MSVIKYAVRMLSQIAYFIFSTIVTIYIIYLYVSNLITILFLSPPINLVVMALFILPLIVWMTSTAIWYNRISKKFNISSHRHLLRDRFRTFLNNIDLAKKSLSIRRSPLNKSAGVDDAYINIALDMINRRSGDHYSIGNSKKSNSYDIVPRIPSFFIDTDIAFKAAFMNFWKERNVKFNRTSYYLEQILNIGKSRILLFCIVIYEMIIGSMFADYDKLEYFGSSIEKYFYSTETPIGKLLSDVPIACFSALSFFPILFAFIRYLNSMFYPIPSRILILRKFNNEEISKGLAGFIGRYLRPIGHPIVLADRDVSRRFSIFSTLYVWVFKGRAQGQFLQVIGNSYLPLRMFVGLVAAPFAFGWVIFISVMRLFDRTRWGPATINNRNDFNKLVLNLENRIFLNIESMQNACGYIIKSSDKWWKVIISTLIKSSDLIVIDVNEIAASMSWEIEQIIASKSWDKVVLIVRKSKNGEIAVDFSKLPKSAKNKPIYTYLDDGFIFESKEFVSECERILVNGK